MNQQKWRGWRYDKATPEQKILTLAGVPYRFWEESKPPRFRPIHFEDRTGKRRTISARSQTVWAKDLKNEAKIIEGFLIVIGSLDEDTQALGLAFDMVRGFIKARGSVQAKVVDLADVPKRGDTDLNGGQSGKMWWGDMYKSQVIMMHNILGKDCTRDRVQSCRDLIRAFHYTTRILVVAGENPITFCQEVLCVKPDVVMYTDGQTSKVVSH